MPERKQLDFNSQANEILYRMSNGGVMATVIDKEGNDNIITLGWGQIGPFYEGHPVFIIAITPLRYSWRFIESVPEFVIAVPDDSGREAATLCGTRSGRELDKFAAAGLTRVPSVNVRPPSVQECPINIECRVYHSVHPPHMLLTKRHRTRPIKEQHTIYFAEVLGTYGWE